MESRSSALVRRAWRAPRNHGAAVIVPAWTDLPDVIAENLSRCSQWRQSPFGLSWTDWREACRRECLAAARGYTAEILQVAVPEINSGPLIVDGHQPELFHPGVWAKNFAIDRLARQTQGTALHLIVDNDVSAKAGVLAPAGTVADPSMISIPYDGPRPQQPWETAAIQDRVIFDRFADRVRQQMQPWDIEPVVAEGWPAAIAQADRGAGLVAALTAARVSVERLWGLQNLELPLSRVCQLPSCWRFMAAIFARLSEFSRQHNAVLHEYRQLNRIRSRSHPVPELAREGDWWEAPFWVSRAGDEHRDRLWVRQAGTQFTLRDSRRELVSWTSFGVDEFAPALAALSDVANQGWRIRTRALTTTLYARLGLADLFVHGLGGAKYDEMTDALMSRFFGVTPPAFLTVSATLHLPLDAQTASTTGSTAHLRQQRRDLLQNPHRYLTDDSNPEVQRLLSERAACLTGLHDEESADFLRPRRLRREAYLQMQAINRELAAHLSPRLAEIDGQIIALERQVAANRVLRSREFSWTLFPAEMLQTTLSGLFDAP